MAHWSLQARALARSVAASLRFRQTVPKGVTLQEWICVRRLIRLPPKMEPPAALQASWTGLDGLVSGCAPGELDSLGCLGELEPVGKALAQQGGEVGDQCIAGGRQHQAGGQLGQRGAERGGAGGCATQARKRVDDCGRRCAIGDSQSALQGVVVWCQVIL